MGKLQVKQNKKKIEFELSHAGSNCSAVLNKDTGELDLQGKDNCTKELLKNIQEKTK